MESCVFQTFLSQQKHQRSNAKRQWQTESGVASAPQQQCSKKWRKRRNKSRRQVEEEEEVAVVVMVKGEVGCPGLPAPYSINSASGFVQQRSAHSVRNIS